MEFNIISTKEFYDTAVNWWMLHNFPVIHISLLPQKVFVASINNEYVYSMFCYETDSALLFLAYPISNKSYDYKKRKGCFEFLVKNIEVWAKTQNYYLLFTTSPIKRVQDVLLNTGFKEGDVKVNQYFKEVI